MKHIANTLKCLGATALLALAVGCATSQSTENMLVASGFKVITPKNAKQEANLKALPTNKVTMVQKGGKSYYVYPDVANNQAYVGGPKQYQAYKQNRLNQKLTNENLEAAEMNQAAAWDWYGWGGWGYGWGPGWYY